MAESEIAPSAPATAFDSPNPSEYERNPLPEFTLDREHNTFTAHVRTYMRTANGTRLERGADGQPILKRDIGEFVFKVPTLDEYVRIGVLRSAKLRGVPVDVFTSYFADAIVTLPLVVVGKPDTWPAWERLLAPRDMEAVTAVFEAYTAGLDQF